MATLEYPHKDSIPSPGEIVEIAEGVNWLRMPMPGRLDHINLWLLRDGNGWTVVDTGMKIEDIIRWWEVIFEKHLEGKPITRVIVTHLHNDHSGLAGFLTNRWGAELWMSRADFFMCKVMASDRPSDVPDDAIRFYRRAGFTQKQLDEYGARFGRFGGGSWPLPAGYRRVVDEEQLEIGGREWRVAIGRGHAPEHVCLFCPELKVIIGGDQLLPRITPNVSVQPYEPRANPLADWLASCAQLRERLPDDLLVLPAHQDIYHGLHLRLTELIEFHENALSQLYDTCREPKRAVDVFAALFKSKVGPQDHTYFAATGESIAHLHYAERRGDLVCEEDDEGVAWYQQS